jgi:hypothetical protein
MPNRCTGTGQFASTHGEIDRTTRLIANGSAPRNIAQYRRIHTRSLGFSQLVGRSAASQHTPPGEYGRQSLDHLEKNV